MPAITDIDITLNGSVLLFFIMLAAGGVSVYFSYRSTTPPVGVWRRALLAAARAGALFTIVALLFTPSITVLTERNVKPEIALLLDTSSSMSMTDNGSNRRETALELLKSPAFRRLRRDFTVRAYAFDRNAARIDMEGVDTLRFTGEGTDIARAFLQMTDDAKDFRLRSVLLISDGIYTIGGDPVRAAEQFGLPVFTVGIGDASVHDDVLISNLRYNEITYAGTPAPVTVSVRSTGYAGAAAVVALRENGKTAASRIIRLPEDNRERSVVLSYVTPTAGTHALTVSVSRQENEVSAANNDREFFIKALESRINILLVSGRPNQDFKFIKRSLEENKNLSVTGLTQRQEGYYFTGASEAINRIGTYSLFILIDFPGAGGMDALANAILQEVLRHKKPILYIRGELLSPDRLKSFATILPAAGFAARGREEEVYLRLNQSAADHPVFRISDDPGENAAIWNKLPPLYTGPDVPIPAAGAAAAAVVDNVRSRNSVFVNGVPMILTSRQEGRKSLLFNVYNLWRWRLMALRDPGIAGMYDRLIENAVRWLTTTEDSKRVRIAANKEFYKNGEEVAINAQVYSENYDPVSDAEVQVVIQKEGMSINRILQPDGEGGYLTKLQILEPGEYSVSGEARLGERLLGRDSAGFAIGKFSVETLKTAMDSLVLGQIAEATHGKYFNRDEAQALPDALDSSQETIARRYDFNFWSRGWMLALMIALLCTEWFLRKRWGML